MNKSLTDKVTFARWCTEYAIDPVDAAVLLDLAQKAFRAGERACNERDRGQQERAAGDRFEAHAQRLGFAVSWPGLWPELTRYGKAVRLP